MYQAKVIAGPCQPTSTESFLLNRAILRMGEAVLRYKLDRLLAHFSISCESLVRVCNTIIQVTYFVVVHVFQIWCVEVSSQSISKRQRHHLVHIINARINHRWRQGEKEKNENLELAIRLDNKLTRFRNIGRSLLTIAFTTRPLTSASQIDILVLSISSKIIANTNCISLQVQEGITCFKRFEIRWKNSLSTLPLPPFLPLRAA